MQAALQRGLGGRDEGGNDMVPAAAPAAAAAQNGESPPDRRPGGGGPACLPSSVSPQAVRLRCAARLQYKPRIPYRLFACHDVGTACRSYACPGSQHHSDVDSGWRLD